MSDFEIPPPALTLDALRAVALRHFGIDGDWRILPSGRDLVARDDGRHGLRIVNAGEGSARIALADAAILHLAQAGVAGIPRLQPNLSGANHGQETLAGQPCLVRVVSHPDGVTLSQAPRSPAQMRNLGGFMGRVTRGLQGFGQAGAIRADFPWSLDNVGALKSHVEGITNPDHRALIQGLFDRYEARTLPVLASLRASVLHQDANENNVILARNDPDQITGLMDFGDMCFGRTVNELAVTLADALPGAKDIYTDARALIEGYVAEFPLLEPEVDQLYDLMRMRLVANVCILARQSRLQPENQYLLISQSPAFALLDRLDRIDPEFMTSLFRRAAGFTATRAEKAVRAHLATTTVAEIFLPPLSRSACMALLTNGEHPDMPAFSDRAFDIWFADRRPAALPAAAAFYGLGAYGEKRSVYATDQFADAASPERRTRHLGIDVFCKAGTPVHAPLAGRVAFVTYNADPLDYGHTLILKHVTPDGTPFHTLYGHLGGSLPGLCKVGDAVAPGQLVAHLGDWHENGGWAPHIHFQVMTDILAQNSGNFFGVGHASLWDVWSGICIDPNLILRLPPESFRVDPNPAE